jgi:hypothetical protein
MFFAAHVFLFKLHLPSRYTQYTFRVLMALAAGMALVLILDAVFRWAEQYPSFLKRLVASGFLALLGILLCWSPLFGKKFLSRLSYGVGRSPALYEFFSRQPKDILIASLAEETNNLPIFSQRSILVGREYAIPYQIGYYRQVRQRVVDLIRAQYSPDLAVVRDFIRKYKLSFWLLDRKSFTSQYLAAHASVNQFQPEAHEAASRLEGGQIPALADFLDRCSVYKDKRFVVLDAKCILEVKRSTGGD